jgi:hypothetical protein
VHGGAIIVRQEQGETGCARAGVQGVVGDLLLPSRSAATGEHGDEIETPGRDVVDGHNFLWCCISSNYSVTVRFLLRGMMTSVFWK